MMGTNLVHQSEVKIRFGIIGCGTITKVKHLPTALSHPDIEVTALIDNDLERVELLKRASGLTCTVSNDYRTVLRDVDAAIVAVPTICMSQLLRSYCARECTCSAKSRWP